MILIGFDLATSSGVCYGRPETVPHAQAVRAPACGQDLGMWGDWWLSYFDGLLARLIQRAAAEEPFRIVYESPLLPQATTLATTRKLQSLGVLLETSCRRSLLPGRFTVHEANLSTLKRALAGHGHASKESMVYVARRAGIQLPQGLEAQDAADSFAAWLMAVNAFSREHKPMWDKRLSPPML